MGRVVGLGGIVASIAFCGFAITQIDQGSSDNGCFEDEAMIRFADRDTCYPYDQLPVELQAYLAPEHWRTPTPGGVR